MVINVNSLTDLSGFYIVYKGSVQNEKKGWYGLSHLMEHLIFHTVDDLLDDFDRDGIISNASTSDNEIVFHITGLDEYVVKYKDKFVERILNFNVTEEMFLNEKKIVLEEYTKYFNMQSHNHYLNLLRKKFNNYSAIGLKEDLKKLTFQDCLDFFELQFTKPHMIINVSKNNIYESDIEFATNGYDNIVETNSYNVPIEPYNRNSGKSSIIVMSDVIKDDFSYIVFIADMLGGGLKSPLYQEIREKRGLVYSLSCSLDSITSNCGIFTISSETGNNNVEEFNKICTEIINNPDKYLTKERFDIVKQANEIRLKKSEINRYNNINKYVMPKDWQIEYILDELTLEKIRDIYKKYFNFEKFHISVDTIDFA